ncbi:MAG TPA: hypothetical protein VGB09_07315, partial [Candidatus Binatia bacterium]
RGDDPDNRQRLQEEVGCCERRGAFTVTHSKDLRAIGQSLEMTRIEVFDLDKQGESYLVRSRFITPTCHWIIKNSLIESVWDTPTPDAKDSPLKGGEGWLRYEPQVISRLDAQGQKKRQTQLPAQAQPTSKPSQHLRTLGEHLDRAAAGAFTISWNHPYSATVTYQTSDGQNEQRTFSFEKLHELGFHMRFRRSRRGA